MGRPEKYSSKYALTELLVCGDCGMPYRRLRQMIECVRVLSKEKGFKCPECGYTCFVKDEKFEQNGSWVTYICQNRDCPSQKRGYPWQKKEFEGK